MHQSEMEEQTEVATDQSYVMDDRGNRKLLFKKRSTSSTCAVCCFICMCTLLYYILVYIPQIILRAMFAMQSFRVF